MPEQTTLSEVLLDFDSEVLTTRSDRVIQVITEVPLITERVTIHQQSPHAFLAREETVWGWEDLRDYVASEITKRFGVFPRDPKKEYGIFTNFIIRWDGIGKDGVATHPGRSVAIAKFAFEVHDGRWKGAPVRFTRFCKGSDPYFAQPIVEYLADHT